MAITYNNEEEISYIGFVDSNGYSLRRNKLGDILFGSGVAVGDCMYFSPKEDHLGAQGSWHNLKFNLSSIIQADNFEVVWEYRTNYVWKIIPGLVDNTNGFKNIGMNTVEYPLPYKMTAYSGSYSYKLPEMNLYGIWVRARVVSATNVSLVPTQNGFIYYNDNTLRIEDEVEFTVPQLLNESINNNWGAVELIGQAYRINANLYMSNSILKSSGEQIFCGTLDNPTMISSSSSSGLQLGEINSEGVGFGGSYLYHNSAIGILQSGYALRYNYKIYASSYIKTSGSYASANYAGVLDIRDSIIEDKSLLYLASGLSLGSRIERSLLDVKTLYVYTSNVSFTSVNIAMAVNSMILFNSGRAELRDVKLSPNLRIYRYYNTQAFLVNCTGVDRTRFMTIPHANSIVDLHIREQFSFNIKVYEKDGLTSISGANVSITDACGDNVTNSITDSNGIIPSSNVTFFDTVWIYPDWKRENRDKNPFSIVISKDGYEPFELNSIQLTNKLDLLVSLKPKVTGTATVTRIATTRIPSRSVI